MKLASLTRIAPDDIPTDPAAFVAWYRDVYMISSNAFQEQVTLGLQRGLGIDDNTTSRIVVLRFTDAVAREVANPLKVRPRGVVVLGVSDGHSAGQSPIWSNLHNGKVSIKVTFVTLAAEADVTLLFVGG